MNSNYNKASWKYAVFALLYFLLLKGTVFAAPKNIVTGDVIVFPVAGQDMQLRGLARSCETQIMDTFERLGRFIPVERSSRKYAVDKALAADTKNVYWNASKIIEADLYVLMRVYRQGPVYIATMTIAPLNRSYKRKNITITVKSRIASALPYKVAREIAYYHKDLPLIVRVLARENGLAVVNVGQWHGIKKGSYTTRSGKILKIIESGRYRSYAVLPENFYGIKLVVAIYTDYEGVVARLNDSLEKVIVNRYALGDKKLKGIDPDKRLIKSMCVINTGANVCLPGYGSYLSTGYIGLDPKNPDMTGLFFSGGAVMTQLTLTEFMTGFKINFLPWIKDSDKSNNIQSLQTFLWASLPLTFSSSFLNQVAHQCEQAGVLPPFFEDKDSAAAVFSLLLPGGGLFYKGHSSAGWGYYFTEMIAASYGFYYYNDPGKSLYAFAAVGVLKLVEIVHAYFADPSYSFYEYEKGRDKWEHALSFQITPGTESEVVYNCALTLFF